MTAKRLAGAWAAVARKAKREPSSLRSLGMIDERRTKAKERPTLDTEGWGTRKGKGQKTSRSWAETTLPE
jgi:hypothetical protein